MSLLRPSAAETALTLLLLAAALASAVMALAGLGSGARVEALAQRAVARDAELRGLERQLGGAAARAVAAAGSVIAAPDQEGAAAEALVRLESLVDGLLAAAPQAGPALEAVATAADEVAGALIALAEAEAGLAEAEAALTVEQRRTAQAADIALSGLIHRLGLVGTLAALEVRRSLGRALDGEEERLAAGGEARAAALAALRRAVQSGALMVSQKALTGAQRLLIAIRVSIEALAAQLAAVEAPPLLVDSRLSTGDLRTRQALQALRPARLALLAEGAAAEPLIAALARLEGLFRQVVDGRDGLFERVRQRAGAARARADAVTALELRLQRLATRLDALADSLPLAEAAERTQLAEAREQALWRLGLLTGLAGAALVLAAATTALRVRRDRRLQRAIAGKLDAQRRIAAERLVQPADEAVIAALPDLSALVFDILERLRPAAAALEVVLEAALPSPPPALAATRAELYAVVERLVALVLLLALPGDRVRLIATATLDGALAIDLTLGSLPLPARGTPGQLAGELAALAGRVEALGGRVIQPRLLGRGRRVGLGFPAGAVLVPDPGLAPRAGAPA